MMSKIRIYINKNGWELFTRANNYKQAKSILQKLDEQNIQTIIIEHNDKTNSDEAITYKLRGGNYMNKELIENTNKMKELEWKSTTDKIIKAIDELKVTTDREEVIKIAVEYMLYKMCETEEIFNDNLKILDEFSNNGLRKKVK